ncbi:MAG: phosphoribosylanthranilate isomerase [Alphaproteobacteria bacterium]|jgi:phosphoribosylanthranilate isomerase|nr:phosphoribosylanthranilate isomerase [Alphaproteobacteria bacterium]
MVQVKICGLTRPEDYQACRLAGADWIGLVHFARSPRHLEAEGMAHLAAGYSDDGPQPVLLSVDEKPANLAQLIAAARPAMLQLHGQESPADCDRLRQKFGLPVMKAIRVKSRADIDRAAAYTGKADWLLFDAAPANASLPGGTGHQLDWGLLDGAEIALPWMLAGGLRPDNLAVALASSGAAAVDVSSGVENTAGEKDAARISAFVRAAKIR